MLQINVFHIRHSVLSSNDKRQIFRAVSNSMEVLNSYWHDFGKNKKYFSKTNLCGQQTGIFNNTAW